MYEMDIEDFIDAELGALSIAAIQAEENCEDKVTAVNILEEGYSEDSQKTAQYLTMLKKPEGMG